MIQISQKDERIYLEVDYVEEFQVAGLGLLIIQIIFNVIALIKNYLDNRCAQTAALAAAQRGNAQRDGVLYWSFN